MNKEILLELITKASPQLQAAAVAFGGVLSTVFVGRMLEVVQNKDFQDNLCKFIKDLSQNTESVLEGAQDWFVISINSLLYWESREEAIKRRDRGREVVNAYDGELPEGVLRRRGSDLSAAGIATAVKDALGQFMSTALNALLATPVPHGVGAPVSVAAGEVQAAGNLANAALGAVAQVAGASPQPAQPARVSPSR